MIKKAKSKIHGYGLFATESIPKNKRIVRYAGEKIDRKEMKRRDQIHKKRGELWCFELNNRSAIDASVGGNLSRFVNHDEKPNCWVEIENGKIWYRASRTIHPEEELTVHYGGPMSEWYS